MNCCRIVRISLGFDYQFVYVDMSQNQNQGNVQLNKNEGDEKKKAKSPMTWHKIECDGSVNKKKDSKVPMYNHSKLRMLEQRVFHNYTT